MGEFWSSFFEHIRSCGKSATLFLISLACLAIAVALAALIFLTPVHDYILPALPFVGIAVVVRLVISIRRARERRRLRTEFGPLSDNELRRARAKLRKAHPGS